MAVPNSYGMWRNWSGSGDLTKGTSDTFPYKVTAHHESWGEAIRPFKTLEEANELADTLREDPEFTAVHVFFHRNPYVLIT